MLLMHELSIVQSSLFPHEIAIGGTMGGGLGLGKSGNGFEVEGNMASGGGFGFGLTEMGSISTTGNGELGPAIGDGCVDVIPISA